MNAKELAGKIHDPKAVASALDATNAVDPAAAVRTLFDGLAQEWKLDETLKAKIAPLLAGAVTWAHEAGIEEGKG